VTDTITPLITVFIQRELKMSGTILGKTIPLDVSDVRLPEGFHITDPAAQRYDECLTYLSKLPDNADSRRLKQSLVHCFEMLGNLRKHNPKSRCELHQDFAPLSFTFHAAGLFGGLIFHGHHDNGGDGGAPTFSVCLEKTHGWSLHT